MSLFGINHEIQEKSKNSNRQLEALILAQLGDYRRIIL